VTDIKKIICCPLCGKTSLSFNIWVKTEVGDILRCEKCGLGFLNLNPKDVPVFEELNLSTYNFKSYYKLLIRMQHELTHRYKNQLKEISKIVKDGGRLVDVGCSIGLFLNTAASFGFEPYGYDVNKINLKKAIKFFGINALLDNFLEDKKYSNLFDVATMWDVLEHLKDPVEYLSKLRCIVKPGGLLVVQCPNMESYEFLKFGNKWNWLTPGDHLQFFTPKSLFRALTTAGFVPIKVKLWCDPLTFSNVMLSLRNRNPTLLFNRLLFKLIKKLKDFFRKFNIEIPFEKVRGLYGWLLQLLYHGGHRHSLVKILALKPNNK
jgi:2-polyprenyl-3-methyl-5-hydroxy-6-metoxy-1,4-benzoquinol methylase